MRLGQPFGQNGLKQIRRRGLGRRGYRRAVDGAHWIQALVLGSTARPPGVTRRGQGHGRIDAEAKPQLLALPPGEEHPGFGAAAASAEHQPWMPGIGNVDLRGLAVRSLCRRLHALDALGSERFVLARRHADRTFELDWCSLNG